jgi:RNA polymerase sigma-70 factor, ECF subfamily
MSLMEFNRTVLVNKLIEGDHDAYTFIFNNFYKRLCIYSYQFVKQMEIAEEIVQEVLFRIWERRSSLNLPENIESYLFRAVHNETINVCKKIQKETKDKIQYHVELDLNLDFNDKIVLKETNKNIRYAIDELPDRCKEVFKMNRFNAMSYKEIAEKLGITEKGVEFHITKALKILREKLKEYVVPVLLILINIFSN